MLLFFPHCLVDQDLKRQAIHGSWAVHGILEGKVDLATGALGLLSGGSPEEIVAS